jgi:hypothetical protein
MRMLCCNILRKTLVVPITCNSEDKTLNVQRDRLLLYLWNRAPVPVSMRACELDSRSFYKRRHLRIKSENGTPHRRKPVIAKRSFYLLLIILLLLSLLLSLFTCTDYFNIPHISDTDVKRVISRLHSTK